MKFPEAIELYGYDISEIDDAWPLHLFDDIPDMHCGPWSIQRRRDGILELRNDGVLWMTTDFTELNSQRAIYERAKTVGGDILIGGLGLGAVAMWIHDLQSSETGRPISIVVLENDTDLIRMVRRYLPGEITILAADVFEYEPQQHFDSVWIDVWEKDSNYHDVLVLRQRYKPYCDWFGAWTSNEDKQPQQLQRAADP